MPDRYDAIRRREHYGADAIKRHRRDTDAFTAGVQYAFDKLLARTRGLMDTDYVVECSADILGDVHEGTL